MKIKPEKVHDSECVIGENPLWHPDEASLYWVDIPAGILMRYDPATGTGGVAYEAGDAIGGVTLQDDGALLLFMARGAVRRLRGGAAEDIIPELPGELDSRFNDVIADPEGRVFCGTMSSDSHKGRLYRLDTDAGITMVEEGIGTSNGMGFTTDNRGFYHTDTRQSTIYLHDYERESGAISNRRVFIRYEGQGRPDGMTVDREGYIWCALWGGSAVVRFTPEGQEDMRITLPALNVTSLAFGGADLCDIYVTTAGGDQRPDSGAGAGALFRFNAGITGRPEYRSRVKRGA